MKKRYNTSKDTKAVRIEMPSEYHKVLDKFRKLGRPIIQRTDLYIQIFEEAVNKIKKEFPNI